MGQNYDNAFCHDVVYLNLMQRVLNTGKDRPNRTGVDTRGVFGEQLRFNLRHTFPLLTSKRVPFKAVAWELLWFMRGETSVKWLQDRGVTIWDEWVKPDGTIGPGYGKQWRNFNGVDQLAGLVKGLRDDPNGRRHILSAWNPAELSEMALPPCHLLCQFHVQGKWLSCQVYQRSADLFLGVPFNIASYALLTHIMAKLTGLFAAELVWTGGDVHIYHNHFAQCQEQLERPLRQSPEFTFTANSPWELDAEWSADYCKVFNYHPHPSIKAPVAI